MMNPGSLGSRLASLRLGAATSQLLFATKTPPVGPIKPPSAWALFVKEQMTGRTGSRVSEHLKALSVQYGGLSAGEKSRYEKEAAAARADYVKQMKALSPADLAARTAAFHEAKQRRHRRARARAKTSLQAPKRPPNAYSAFLSEQLSEKSELGESAEVRKASFKSVAQAWRELPASERQRRQREAAKVMDAWRSEWAKWESRMSKEGHQEKLELIKALRPSTLPAAKAKAKEKAAKERTALKTKAKQTAARKAATQTKKAKDKLRKAKAVKATTAKAKEKVVKAKAALRKANTALNKARTAAKK